jgi:hypothetical protein
MVGATAGCRWIFLARPWPGAAAVQAHLDIRHEMLEGFSLQDIAAEFRAQNSPTDVPAAERVRRVTGGLPLFVRDSARLTARRYAGDANAFCAAVESRTNPYVNGQDVIVREVINHVSPGDRNVAGVIALSDLPLTRDEAIQLTTVAVQIAPAVATSAVRELVGWGIVQESLTGEIAVHDAFRGDLADVRAQVDAEVVDRGYRALGRILVASFGPGQFDRLVQFCKIAPRIGQVQTLIDISSDFSEQLQERGKAEELIRIVDDAADDERLPPIERFWAADTVAFWRIWGTEADVEGDIARLASLLALDPKPPSRALVNLENKRLVLAARRHDVAGVRRHYAAALRAADSSLGRRIVRYNYAVGLHTCDEDQSALFACAALVRDYFSHFRITPPDLFMKNAPEVHQMLGDLGDEYDELKRFADSLQLSALAANALGRPGGLVRIWAHKLYLLAWAPRSAVRVGMDVVDEMLGMLGDAIGARQFIERALAPTVDDLKLLSYVVPVQAQYAVVRAYCGDYDGARRLITELGSFAVDELAAAELENQRQLVERIAAGRRPLRRLPPTPGAGPVPAEFVALPERGRNDQCFCESGLKYKQCCGRQDA